MALFNDDEKPTSSHAGSTRGLVTVKPVRYSKDDAALTADTAMALIELNATTSTAVREGLDLVAVLDVSGSMTGPKLRSMKKGMHFVIAKLSPVDRLSIVTFSKKATRHCPLRSVTEAAKAELRAIVGGLVARRGGGTNIESGMDTALAILAGRATVRARTANVLLMSDGRQKDESDARRTEPGKVAVHTFALGKDADHGLLSDMASKSMDGTFSSVVDRGSVSIPLSQLLAGLLTVVAQDVQLTLTPKTDDPRDLDAMFVVVAPGSESDYTTHTTDEDSGVITIKFGALFSGESRKVLVNLTLLDSDDTAEYDAPLAEAQHSYTAQNGVQRQTPQDILICRTPNPSEPALPAGANADAWAWDPEVARRRHASAIHEARVLADGKNLDEARHRLTDDAARRVLSDECISSKAGSIYFRQDAHTRKMEAMLRDEMQQLLALMESQELYETAGHPYALACERSHGRQRYMAWGSDVDAVRLFATPRMDLYLQQAKEFDDYPTAPLPSAADDTTTISLADISAQLAIHADAVAVELKKMEKLLARSTT